MKTIKRMVIELDEYLKGLKGFVLSRLFAIYLVIAMLLVVDYLTGRYWLLDVAFLSWFLPLPVVSTIIALFMIWYLDVKPKTDKQDEV